jgi:hypothetical protein
MRTFGLSLSIAISAWLLVSAVPVGAQEPREEPKLALVIGNSTYREAPLRNPANDARAMAQTLRELGFTVLAHENAAKRTMESAILEFGRRLVGRRRRVLLLCGPRAAGPRTQLPGAS